MSATALDTTMATASLIASSPAKLNLTLEVLGSRDDGFHEIRSLVVGVDLCDRVRCCTSPVSGVAIACTERALQNDENLASRAANKLAARLRRKPALRIEIEKRIPVAAGLGGGSSNAATALRLCNELWAGGLGSAELAPIGAELGSDVPLFFSLPSALITGRGERVEPVALRWSGWVLLAFVDTMVPTARVYGAWRASDAAAMPGHSVDAVAGASSAEELSAMLFNHLEPAVCRVSPAVARAFAEVNRPGAGSMRVAGAGSTLYRLFDEKEAACQAAMALADLRADLKTVVVQAPTGPSAIVAEEC